MRAKKVAFTMLPVIEMKRARMFYEEKLGLKMTGEFANGKWIEYDLPEGGCIAITDMVKELSPSSDAGASVAIEVDEIEKFVAKLKNAGVKIKLDTFPTPVCKMAVVLDSEGNGVTIHQCL